MSDSPLPKVSVVMPVRNCSAWLRETLDSILAQTWRDFELIAVNDRSTDDTPAILQAAAVRDTRVHVLENNGSGLVPALNTGMAAARGEFISRMDGDDFMPQDRLWLQADYLMRNATAVVVTGHVEHWGDLALTQGYSRYVDFLNSLKTPEDYFLRQFIESPVAHPSVMIRSAALDQQPYRDGNFPEDYDLWLRLLGAGHTFHSLPQTVLKWRDYPQRTSRVDPRYDIERFYRHKAGFIAAWLRNHGHGIVRVWSGGRRTRRRIDALRDAGIQISTFIDVHPRRIGQNIAGTPVIHPDDLITKREGFILVYVGSKGTRESIGNWLANHQFKEGTHFLFAA